MRRYGGMIIAVLVLANTGLAGLIPFQVTGETAVPTTEDSIAIYELVVTTDTTGKLNWLFRLGDHLLRIFPYGWDFPVPNRL